MARLRGARIAVNAPNSATNVLLQSAGFQQLSRQVASGLYAQIRMASYREKPERQPRMTTQRCASTFQGTRRAGTSITGMKRGMRREIVERAVGGQVTWR